MSINKKKQDNKDIKLGLVLVLVIILSTVIMLQKTADLVKDRRASKFETIDSRIEPFGKVNMPSSGTVESVAVINSIEKSETIAKVYTGSEIYNMACTACHTAGIAGSPKLTDTLNWEPRIKQGIDTLRAHAINGYTGLAGYMPPKGGRLDLSDMDINNAIDYMLSQIQQ
ncbi:MAG: cytochrome c5 [Woeseiaceae bacterium]